MFIEESLTQELTTPEGSNVKNRFVEFDEVSSRVESMFSSYQFISVFKISHATPPGCRVIARWYFSINV
jgi:hypothetical protein